MRGSAAGLLYSATVRPTSHLVTLRSRKTSQRIVPAAAVGERFVPYSCSGVLKCCGRRPLLGLVQSGSLRFQSSTIVSPDGQP